MLNKNERRLRKVTCVQRAFLWTLISSAALITRDIDHMFSLAAFAMSHQLFFQQGFTVYKLYRSKTGVQVFDKDECRGKGFRIKQV